MSFAEYGDHDAVGLAALVRDGHVHAGEVVDAAIDAIGRHNPVFNAVVFTAYDEARRAAATSSVGLFAGVPFLVKDLGLQVSGWPRTSGSRFGMGITDNEDCGLVKRYRGLGLALLGRSASSEFGMIGTTETAAYGPTRNPWNPAHIAGGSSGGAAAAVASGMVPLAHASDGLGSIRIPAACCGLVGLKPTRDRVPNLPDGPEYAIGFVADHVVCRTVRDAAAMLDATGQPEPGSPYALPRKTGAFSDALARPPARLRIHWSSHTRIGGSVDAEVQARLEATAALLEDLGHDVRPEPLAIDEQAMTQARLPISAAAFSAAVAHMIREVGREPAPGDFEPLTLAAWTLSRQVTGEMVIAGMERLRVLSRQVVAQFDVIDVYLTPVMTRPPPAIGTIDGLSQHPALVDAAQFSLYPYAMIANFTGQPSISLPLGQSVDGLPIGMMFTSRYGDEATLLSLARQLEQALPWRERRPLIFG